MTYGFGLGFGAIEPWGSIGLASSLITTELGDFNFSCKAMLEGYTIQVSFDIPSLVDAPQWTGRLRILRKQGEWPQSWDDNDAYVSLDDVFPLAGSYSFEESGLEQGIIYYYALFALGIDTAWVHDERRNRCSKYPHDRWGFQDYQYNSLPRGYRSQDAEIQHLYQFLSVIGSMLDGIKTDAENLLTLFSANEVHDDLIYLIDKKLGWPTWHVAGGLQRREETLAAVDLYKILGTTGGYEQLLEAVSNWDVTVVEGWKYVFFSNNRFDSKTPDMTDPDTLRLRGYIDDILKYTPETDRWHSVNGLGFFLEEIPGVSAGISASMIDRINFLIEWGKASYVTTGIIVSPIDEELVFVLIETMLEPLHIHSEEQGVATETDLGYTTTSWNLFESLDSGSTTNTIDDRTFHSSIQYL